MAITLQQPKTDNTSTYGASHDRDLRRKRDDQCEGDILWEQRMKKLNPSWHPSENSLWDAYHE